MINITVNIQVNKFKGDLTMLPCLSFNPANLLLQVKEFVNFSQQQLKLLL